MMKPKVGLTLLTSSFMIFFTIVVLPALSSPLHLISNCRARHIRHSQHQDPHLFVFKTRLAEYRQHLRLSTFFVGFTRREEQLKKRRPGEVSRGAKITWLTKVSIPDQMSDTARSNVPTVIILPVLLHSSCAAIGTLDIISPGPLHLPPDYHCSASPVVRIRELYLFRTRGKDSTI